MSDAEDFDFNQYSQMMLEHQRWASACVMFDEISKENKALVRDLAQYDPAHAIPVLAGLLTMPQIQSNCIRLEVLAILAVIHCKGKKKANVGQAVRWFKQIGKSSIASGEDDAEDVFVSLVQNQSGNYRMLEGIWESAGFYTQRFSDVLDLMPNEKVYNEIRRAFYALLKISDIVCERSNLKRYQLGSDVVVQKLDPKIVPSKDQLMDRVTISFKELKLAGIALDDIRPFIFVPPEQEKLLSECLGEATLERFPLLVNGQKNQVVVYPTAISVAARQFVIDRMFEIGLADNFEAALAGIYKKVLFETPLLGGPLRSPIRWMRAGDHYWSCFYMSVDKGYYASFHFFMPSIKVHKDGGFKTLFHDEEGKISEVIKKSIDDSVEDLEKKEDFKEGLIFTVGCGWGKGAAMRGIDVKHSKWSYESISVADLVRLSWLSDISPSYIWRVQHGLEAIARSGVEILNPNGLLNLIAWVRNNDGHFVPHSQLREGRVSPERPLLLNPPLNGLREVRASSDTGFDRHRVQDKSGRWHEVQRPSSNPYFSRPSSAKVFVSLSDVHQGRLTSVYEGDGCVWVSVDAPNIQEKDIACRLHEMVTEWLHRICEAVAVEFGEDFDGAAVSIVLEFEDSDAVDVAGEWPTVDELESRCVLTNDQSSEQWHIKLMPGFIRGFRIPENVAERIIVRFISKAVLSDIGLGSPESVEDVVSTTMPNEEGRSFHLFHAQRFIDYVRESLPEDVVVIDEIDDAVIRLGMGWKAKIPGSGDSIHGLENCTKYLNQVVALLCNELQQELSQYNRIMATRKLYQNTEKALSLEDHWERTSAAMLGLHGDSPETVSRFVEQSSRHAGAGIASRTLAEIGICCCPLEGGIELSNIELSKLIAKAAMISRFGGLSDAIRFHAFRPEIVISPLGDIMSQDQFGKLVVQPTLSKMMGMRLKSIAPEQQRNYSIPPEPRDANETLGAEFLSIWHTEMGFTIDDAKGILGALDEYGVERQQAVFDLREAEFFKLAFESGISDDEARAFLDRFTLSTREKWDVPPEGVSIREIYPWKFGRRLSMVTRPILRLDVTDDPLLILGPNLLRRGFAYVLDGAFNGRLGQGFFDTAEMRNDWLGRAHEGHTFNGEAADELRRMGWTVRQGIGLPELLNQKLDRDYGDIDLFAWKPDFHSVLVAECKDLSVARNYSEIAQMLSDFQGEKRDGKPDLLLKHLERVQVVKEHLDRVSKFSGVENPQIVSALVFSDAVPMEFAKIDALEGSLVGSVEDIVSGLRN